MKARVVDESLRAIPLGAYASSRNDLHYVFLRDTGAYALSYRLAPGEKVSASSSALPGLAWDEREIAQERGIVFEAPIDERPLRAAAGCMHFVVGPVHAGIIEPGRFTFSSGGETVLHLDVQLGYAHRSVEAHCEGVPVLQAAPLIARICGGCSAARSFAYARALESLAGMELGPEIELARLMLAELERVYNHLGDLAACASSAGWMPGYVQGMSLKERAMRLCAIACGHRLLFDAIVPGGVGERVFLDRALFAAELDALDREIHAFLKRLFTHRSVLSRWRRTGMLRPETARAFIGVGPAHRACGTGIDVRAYAPYGAYRLLRIEPALGKHGDVLARCQVKREELSSSLRLIREASHRLGESALPATQPLGARAGVAVMTLEGPRGAETLAVHVSPDGRLERVHAISASYRNWPLVAQAATAGIVPDFPLINKSFNLCYACADR